MTFIFYCNYNFYLSVTIAKNTLNNIFSKKKSLWKYFPTFKRVPLLNKEKNFTHHTADGLRVQNFYIWHA